MDPPLRSFRHPDALGCIMVGIPLDPPNARLRGAFFAPYLEGEAPLRSSQDIAKKEHSIVT